MPRNSNENSLHRMAGVSQLYRLELEGRVEPDTAAQAILRIVDLRLANSRSRACPEMTINSGMDVIVPDTAFQQLLAARLLGS